MPAQPPLADTASAGGDGHRPVADSAASATAEAVVVPLSSRRGEKVERVQAAIDGVSAVMLALEARERLARGGGAAALGWAELAVAALLAAATIAMLRGRSHFGRWVSALAGLVLLLEGLSKTYGPKGHPSWALTLNGLLLLAMAAMAPRFEAWRARRRVLRLDDEGISYRRSRLRAFEVRRGDVASVAIGETLALVRTRGGRERRIDLADLHDRSEVVAALGAWSAAHGIEVTGDSTALR
jgi:hypothetical protein